MHPNFGNLLQNLVRGNLIVGQTRFSQHAFGQSDEHDLRKVARVLGTRLAHFRVCRVGHVDEMHRLCEDRGPAQRGQSDRQYPQPNSPQLAGAHDEVSPRPPHLEMDIKPPFGPTEI